MFDTCCRIYRVCFLPYIFTGVFFLSFTGIFFDVHSIGLDGAVIVEVMQERGVSTLAMEGYAQRLRRGEGAKGADPVYPRLLDFWQVRREV